MAYTKTTWVDRSVQYPSRFTRTNDGTYDTLTPAPGTITNAGTPITSTALNNMEDGIGNNDSRLSTVEGQYIGTGANGVKKIEVESGQFFTNGTSSVASATITFAQAYAVAPTIMPGNVTSSNIPYSDAMKYPQIFNVTTTGFQVNLNAIGGNFGTPGTPANIFMNFLVFGK